jgi:hypothetical protein
MRTPDPVSRQASWITRVADAAHDRAKRAAFSSASADGGMLHQSSFDRSAARARWTRKRTAGTSPARWRDAQANPAFVCQRLHARSFARRNRIDLERKWQRQVLCQRGPSQHRALADDAKAVERGATPRRPTPLRCSVQTPGPRLRPGSDAPRDDSARPPAPGASMLDRATRAPAAIVSSGDPERPERGLHDPAHLDDGLTRHGRRSRREIVGRQRVTRPRIEARVTGVAMEIRAGGDRQPELSREIAVMPPRCPDRDRCGLLPRPGPQPPGAG